MRGSRGIFGRDERGALFPCGSLQLLSFVGSYLNTVDMEQGREDDTTSLIEQLSKALLELKDTSENKIQWVEIEQHFHDLEATLKKKFEELEAKERQYEEKEAEMHMLLGEREAAVASKEQDLLDRVQKLKDAAVADIVEARANHQISSLESVETRESINNKVSSPLGDKNSPLEDFPHKQVEYAEGLALEVKPRPELIIFCEQMDAKGLLNYIADNKNNLSVMSEELAVALETATEPVQLVLDSLEGFYPTSETTQVGDKTDAALQGMRQSCITIIKALANLLAGPGVNHLLNPETKQQAKAIADEWMPKLTRAGIDAANGNSLEAEAFLQLLSTFRIASEFDEEELCKLVLAVSQHRQAPELCRSLVLTHKVPAIVEFLINEGKQIAAVHFIHAFQLNERFPSVPLLRAYLKELRRNSQGKKGCAVAGVQNDANAQELAALKVVIKCVEEYKLESEYPLDPLKKRVAQLEKSKAEKKRSGEFRKIQQSKKPRANWGYFAFRQSGGSAPSSAIMGRQPLPVKAAYAGMPYRYRHAGPITRDYEVPGQAIYTQPAIDQRLPSYAQDDRATALAHNITPSNYGSSFQSSHQPYM
ncbi:hypothetical protein L6164_019859 [Bauhinia variegata]|uniref:Uncharacterized protein n=1 Tax=Bauhinia variegata TaxID=167791 RepID=A0ACB9MU01_BAUVA|nr:hypothetical protein L6164_019859 [Bauhinia variegata]